MNGLFFDRLKRIDTIIGRGALYCNFSQDLEPLLKEDASKRYFYDKLQDIQWLEILDKANVFGKVPEPIEDREKGTIVYLSWPESIFLKKMASQLPEKVTEIALRVPDNNNYHIYEDLADIALIVPSNLAAKFVSKSKIWIKTDYLSLLPEKLGNLVSYLSKGRKNDEALDLTRSLLGIKEKNGRANINEKTTLRNPLEPQGHFDTWYYERILINNIPDLIEATGQKGLILLCDLLEEAIQISRQQEDKRPEDNSFVWRPAIEDHDQNNFPNIKSLLTMSIRDAAETLMETEGKETLDLLSSRHFKVFHRISLYLRQKWPETDPEGTANIITNLEFFDDIALHHEFYYLLKKQFGNLSKKNQKEYLDIVTGINTFQDFIELHGLDDNNKMDNAEKERFIRHWRYSKLWPIQEFLDGEWKKIFDNLKNEFKEPDHPDFHYYSSSVSIGLKSPLLKEEIENMTIDELISYLKTWESTEEFMAPDQSDLAQMLSILVSQRIEYYAINAQRFRGVKPIYIAALLRGLRQATQVGPFSWESVLDLCLWTHEQSEKNGQTENGDTLSENEWCIVRGAIADLISDGLISSKAEIPFNLRNKVWNVILPLTIDADPSPNRELDYTKSVLAPFNLSINSIRGDAIHSVIHYALWVRKNICVNINEKLDEARNFDEMPEVKEVLEFHLDIDNDPSLAIHSIYGRWFPWLVKLDCVWATANVAKIFPSDPKLSLFRQVAWETYLTQCGPYVPIYKLLNDEYNKAIEKLNTEPERNRGSIDPDKHLAEHIMTFNWQGIIDINDPEDLIARFYKKAPETLRTHALWHVGRSLYHTKEEIKSEILNRVQALWLKRKKEVQEGFPTISLGELAPFGWWFVSAKFDDIWTITQLKDILEMNVKVVPDYFIIERLSKLAQTLPGLVIDCLILMIENDEEGMRVHSWRKYIQEILTKVIQSGDKDAKHSAVCLIHELGARGYIELRKLIPENNDMKNESIG
jgi:hypothetical protein